LGWVTGIALLVERINKVNAHCATTLGCPGRLVKYGQSDECLVKFRDLCFGLRQ
jgi:hypothetical protein